MRSFKETKKERSIEAIEALGDLQKSIEKPRVKTTEEQLAEWRAIGEARKRREKKSLLSRIATSPWFLAILWAGISGLSVVFQKVLGWNYAGANAWDITLGILFLAFLRYKWSQIKAEVASERRYVKI
jgi:hypothetical protein